MLTAIAWTILDNKRIEKRDPDLALEAAKRANEITNGAKSDVLDTLAYAYYHKGDAKKALELQNWTVLCLTSCDYPVNRIPGILETSAFSTMNFSRS
jgi:hypothetical protein